MKTSIEGVSLVSVSIKRGGLGQLTMATDFTLIDKAQGKAYGQLSQTLAGSMVWSKELRKKIEDVCQQIEEEANTHLFGDDTKEEE